MELNFNTLILSLSKIKNLGRKRIFNLLSNIKNIDDHLINDIFIELKLNEKLSFDEFKTLYLNSIDEVTKIEKSGVKIINIFENDEFGIFKNKYLLKNKNEISEFPNQLFILNKSNLKLDNNKNIFTIIGTRNNSESKIITQKITNFLIKKINYS